METKGITEMNKKLIIYNVMVAEDNVGTFFCAAFSTYENANTFIQRCLDNGDLGEFFVEEYEVDSEI